MKKIIIICISILLLYQTIAFLLLYNSSYLNVVSYYTHPPTRGAIELKRMPMLFGDAIAIHVLKFKKKEATKLIDKGEIGLAAILASHQHNQVFSQEEAKYRSIRIAELFVKAGYDAWRCESDGRSTAEVLEDWGALDRESEKFLVEILGEKELRVCR